MFDDLFKDLWVWPLLGIMLLYTCAEGGYISGVIFIVLILAIIIFNVVKKYRDGI